MQLVIPEKDGEINPYVAVLPPNNSPRIYYVNGIQTTGAGHAQSAMALSVLTEHVVYGVHNATAGIGAGIALDFLQCLGDWFDSFASQVGEFGVGAINGAVNKMLNWVREKTGRQPGNPVNAANAIRSRLSEQQRVALVETLMTSRNLATLALFRQLATHRDSKQIIVAHSQGNLITAGALWSMAIAYGNASLKDMQVFSLASPSPAWPEGINYRRKVYGHTNDLVTLCDPHNWTFISEKVFSGKFGRTAGDWRKHGTSALPGLAGHDLNRNVALNFYTTIRRELGLPPLAGTIPAF